MKLSIYFFKGEAPRLSPRLLPPEAAQEAMNARLETGDITPFRQFVNEKELAAAASTIYKLNGSWLSWNAQVDAARGLIPGDTNYFLFLTGPSLYTTPRYTTFALATTGAEPFPVETRPLGMPAPTDPPTLVKGVDTTGSGTVIDVLDEGNEIASWTVPGPQNPPLGRLVVEESAVTGNPVNSYHLECDRGSDSNTHSAFMYRDFGIGSAAAISYKADFLMHGAVDSDRRVMCVHVANEVDGNGITVWYDNVTNPELNIGISTDGWTRNALNSYTSVSVGAPGFPGPLDEEKWYRIEVDVEANSELEQTVTARLYDGVTLLGTATSTNSWNLGAYCGHVFHVYDDSAAESSGAYYDNIHVEASGTRGAVIVNTATSYVYTFINDDIGDVGVTWESAPSPASATILRPDGVKVTVTTATSHAYDAAYGINKKRIYRAVSGATGDIFLLVAEIPLATADYEDILDDATISTPGTPLESEDWDLPPANMQGIISLPNNIMAGFFANQLCLSAVGHPHAWPVKYRLTTDTDIVAIANIDNVIVIGTKSRVQTAAGNDPANYSMSQPGEAQACVSKRSMVYLDGYGVVFASPDGYQVCAGSAGNVKNATEGLFTKQQWQALKPATIIAAVYDGVLYFWYDPT